MAPERQSDKGRGRTMAVTVRRAEPGDAPELARLRWEFRPQDQPNQEWEAFSQEFEEWLAQALASAWVVSVADQGDGILVGCMFLRSVGKVPNPGTRDRAWGYVTNSYVAPTHRGRGIGARLLDVLVGGARERGHEFLIVWPSEKAVSFYARAGFREVVEVHSGADDHSPLELLLT
ncbi:MAG TPA: N-acetyltransferase [Longimicrobiales bacterium]|nr:N-acetyltransferase [Longimicrobiales bacterium]